MSVQVKPTTAPTSTAKPATGSSHPATDAAGGFAALFDALRSAVEPSAGDAQGAAADSPKRRADITADAAATDPALNAYAASAAAAALVTTTASPANDATKTPGTADAASSGEAPVLGNTTTATTNLPMGKAAQEPSPAADDAATRAFARQVQTAIAAQREAAADANPAQIAANRQSRSSSAINSSELASTSSSTAGVPSQTATETAVASPPTRSSPAANARALDLREALATADETRDANAATTLVSPASISGNDAATATPGTPPSHGVALPTAALNATASAQTSAPPGPPVNLQNPHWAGDLGQRIDWMQHQGVSRADIQVNPEHLGPIRIQIDLRHDSATVSLSAQHADTRDLLNQGLAQLQAALQPTTTGTVTTQVVQPELLLSGNPFANPDFQRSESSQDRNEAPRRGINGLSGRGTATAADETATSARTQRGAGLLDTFA